MSSSIGNDKYQKYQRVTTEASDAPAVTVLMPVWNCVRFTRHAIRSILAQSFTNYEFIIVDDGSTDGTFDVIKQFAEEDQRIHLISRENRGLVASLNEGLSVARAPLVARMDGDDIATENRLAVQVAEFERRADLVLLGGQAQLIDAMDNPGRMLQVPNGIEQTRKALLVSCPFIHPSVMFRRKPVLEVGGYRDKYRHAEDYDLWLRLSSRGEIDNLPDIVLKFRRHGESVTDRHAKIQAISTALALESYHAQTFDRPDPLEELNERPKDFSTAIGLFKDSQSHQRMKISYLRSLVYSGAIKHELVARELFVYLRSMSNERAGEQSSLMANVMIRAMMQFFRFGQYRNATFMFLWALNAMPVASTMAFIQTTLKRVAHQIYYKLAKYFF